MCVPPVNQKVRTSLHAYIQAMLEMICALSSKILSFCSPFSSSLMWTMCYHAGRPRCSLMITPTQTQTLSCYTYIRSLKQHGPVALSPLTDLMLQTPVTATVTTSSSFVLGCPPRLHITAATKCPVTPVIWKLAGE